MTDNTLDFLDETLNDQPEQVDTPEPVETVEAEAEAPDAETDSKGETAEPPAAPDEKTKEVPFVALMDEREKRQAAQRELEEVRKKLAAFEQKPAEKPDFYDNPEAVVQQSVMAATLKQSKFLAEKEYGADVVAEAYAYFDKHPQESQALLQHPSPFHAAVEHYKRQAKLAEIGSDPDAYINAQVEARIAERLAQSPTPKAPPPSMAKAPSTGGERISPGSAFDEAFPG